MQNFDDMGEIAYIQSKKNGAQINDIANQIEELQNSGVDTEARASIAKIEKDLNDYKQTMAGVNVNQEATQQATGFGVVSLPKNAANGQFKNVSVFGSTETDGDSTKSTLTPMRLKSVGKNLFNKNINFTKYNIPSQLELTKVQIDGRPNVLKIKAGLNYNFVDLGIRFKPNTSYVFKFDMRGTGEGAWDTALHIIYTDGSDTYARTSRSQWQTETIITPQDKSIDYIAFKCLNGFSDGYISYIDLDTFQIEEGDTATEYEPYKEGTAYITAKNPETGDILELRSLPNGVKDEVSLNDKKLTKNISDDTTISDIAYASLDTTTYTNVDVVITTAFADAKAGTTGADGQTHYYNKDGVELAEVAQADIDLEASVGKYYWGEDKKLYIIVAKGTYADIAAARTGLGTTPLTYQLAMPVETPVQVSGTLVSYPSGTVYIEPYVADAGIYTHKMEVLYSDLPIKALEKISKVDFESGLETELDVSAAVIAEDKLSFTHPDLTSGDIVFFVYEHGAEGTIPETEISYYDSRYVIKGEDDKFYQWEIEAKLVEDVITPSIKLVEV